MDCRKNPFPHFYGNSHFEKNILHNGLRENDMICKQFDRQA